MFAPLVVGACFCVISHLLDRLNTHVLRDCYRLAREMEDKIVDGGGIFKCIENIPLSERFLATLAGALQSARFIALKSQRFSSTELIHDAAARRISILFLRFRRRQYVDEVSNRRLHPT